MQLVSRSFVNQALAFPDKVKQELAKVETVTDAKELLDKGMTLQDYSRRLKAGIEVERPIAYGNLMIKAKLGELMPAAEPGRGKTAQQLGDFNRNTRTAYRKMAKHSDRLDEYYESIEEVPTQTDFIKWAQGYGNHVEQNSGENEWYTPREYIDAAREVLGAIDLDPASSPVAQRYIKAKRHYTIENDGLSSSKRWKGSVWMNPPYSSDLVSRFIAKLVSHFAAGDVTDAIVLVNNATETAWFQALAAASSALCFPEGRIRFLDSSGEPAKTPLQGQAFAFLGKQSIDAFVETFSKFGFVARV